MKSIHQCGPPNAINRPFGDGTHVYTCLYRLYQLFMVLIGGMEKMYIYILGFPHDPALKLMLNDFARHFLCQTPWVPFKPSLAMKTEWSRPQQIYLSRKGQSGQWLTHPLQLILKLRNLKPHFNFKHNPPRISRKTKESPASSNLRLMSM